ncbi:unnamed protein product [Effrenium voratum]|uniref:Uncharacterized protein n=1 Tax=Effrenium voratum TaxID=2562239 RepID=A0AA36HNF7_9DINO|nr:unnamed protein product [Effrenium voratum]CAJ1459583.1 unnamed protein product [Effrenium voratum]
MASELPASPPTKSPRVFGRSAVRGVRVLLLGVAAWQGLECFQLPRWSQPLRATSVARPRPLLAMGRRGSPNLQTARRVKASRGELQDVNLFGGPLQSCTQGADGQVTGWTRTGSCAWEPSDLGFHQVCVTMSDTFLASSARYDKNDLRSVVQSGGHWCICAWAWAAAVSRDPKTFEGLQLDCDRTNGHLRDVYHTYAEANEMMTSPSGAKYEAQKALAAVDALCRS